MWRRWRSPAVGCRPGLAAPGGRARGRVPAADQSVVVSSTFTHVEIDVILILLNYNLLRIISMYRHRLGPRTSRTSRTSPYVDELTFVAVQYSDGFYFLLTCITISVNSVYDGSSMLLREIIFN